MKYSKVFFPIVIIDEESWKKRSEVTQLCPTLCNLMDYSLPGSSIHGIFQARILEWVAIYFPRCRSPAPAARESAWRDERCWRGMMQPLTQGAGLHVYFKLQVLFYTLTKALGQRFDIFCSPSPRFIVSLLPFKQSSCFSDSLRIVFTCDYIVTHAYVWAAYHIPQFISYLSKSCLSLVS